MTKLVFDEDRDLPLSQPSGFVKLAAALCLVGALLGGSGAIQLALVLERAIDPPIFIPIAVYGGVFVAPLLGVVGLKLFRLASWAPVAAIAVGSVGTLLGLGQLAFMFRFRFMLCLGVVGPATLCFATLASVLAYRSAEASIAARERLSDAGIELGV